MVASSITGNNRVMASATATAAQRVKVSVAADEKIHVSAVRLQMDGLRLQDRLAREAQRAADRKVSDAARLDAIQDRYVKRDYDRRVKYERMKVAESARANERLRTGMESALTTAAAASAAGLKLWNDGSRQIRENFESAARAVLAMQKDLRLEGTLKGLGGGSSQALFESLRFRERTGLGAADASNFTRQYLGSVDVGLAKQHITKKVSDELMEASGRRLARLGGDAATEGEFSGLIAQAQPIRSAAQGIGIKEAVRQNLASGRGDDPVLEAGLLRIMGSNVGEGASLKDLLEASALLGVVSLGPGAPARASGPRS